ncbi:MAG: TetR/AcrR family transcriptional regulator [Candidatus Kapaibacteriota bacterium]|jgi:AcrR family transcriptional regulator
MKKIPPKPQKTQERIVETALILFNEYGADNVSTRQIASAMGIAQGNLSYHFPRKEDIIAALYDRLVATLSASISEMETRVVEYGDLSVVLESVTTTFSILYEYKFFMLDFVSIMRNNPTIKKHYQELQTMRRQQFAGVRALMIQKGWMKKELMEQFDTEIDELMQIVGDFWISSAEILYQGKEKDKLAHYTRIFSVIIAPYLTPKGMKEFQNMSHSEA